MIYLIFDCISTNRTIMFNEEFQDIAWVSPNNLKSVDLNEATRITFSRKGLL
ncbi:Nucleoside triphosphatase NudI (plasmid) [Enterobacter cloacae]|nr:Nucleoside triphosphatase NudI [Enterobacter cloacae]